jgi:hypothetical protein
MNPYDRTLRVAADKYIDQANAAGVPTSDSGPLRGAFTQTFDVIETFQAARTTLLGDPHLSDQGKADRIAKLEADARRRHPPRRRRPPTPRGHPQTSRGPHAAPARARRRPHGRPA